ncbi:MAG: ATP synthase F1 subunit delta [Armatimonadetes bacterium]|nr:ATP synthase F1 subunit delta [Armatimonadota bacterium]
MISERIARRYVRALFDLAHEANQADEVGASLHDLQQIYHLHTKLRNALADPRLAPEKKRSLLRRLMGHHAPDLLLRFIDLLIEKHRLQVLHYAGTIFARLQDEAAGIQQAVVHTPLPLSEDQQFRLQDTLSNLLGLQIVLTTIVDPRVIGGICVRVGDLMIDGSIRGRLQGLLEEYLRTKTAVAG